ADGHSVSRPLGQLSKAFGENLLKQAVLPDVGAASTGTPMDAEDFADPMVLKARHENIGGAVTPRVDDERDRPLILLPQAVVIFDRLERDALRVDSPVLDR